MSTLIGVGKSKASNVDVAAREAVELAIKPLIGNKPNIIFLYATFGYDFKELVKKVKEYGGGAFVVGGSVYGVIDKIDGGDTQFHRIIACAIYSDDFRMTPIIAKELSKDSKVAGSVLGEIITNNNITDIKGLYLILDGLKAVDPDSMLNEVSKVIPKNTAIFGGSAAEPLLWKNTYQFYDNEVLEDSVVGVVFSGKVSILVASSHGSESIGEPHVITKAVGATIYEIENEPAINLFKELYNEKDFQISGLTAAGVCLGTKVLYNDGMDEVIELRIPLSSNPDGSIVMAAAWPVGAKIYVCQRDLEIIPKRNNEVLTEVLARKNGKMPFVVFEANCLGRSPDKIGQEASDIEIKSSLSLFDDNTLWFGSYMYGELASIEGVPAFHNWTGSFALFYLD